MNTDPDTSQSKKDRAPPAVLSENPEEQLERELAADPNNASKKVDVGSDESMDASDPVSAALPEHREPVPSSGFEEEEHESKP